MILTSDNGTPWTPEDKQKYPHRANAGWRGMKADIWEAGHRVPFLARWPGVIEEGTTSNELGCLTDLLATTASITGTKLPRDAGEDSFDLTAALRTDKRAKPARDAVVHHSSTGLFAIRQGEWKLIEGRGSGGFSVPRTVTPGPGEPAGELYNLRQDPGETKNLFASEPARVAALQALLDRYRHDGRSRPL